MEVTIKKEELKMYLSKKDIEVIARECGVSARNVYNVVAGKTNKSACITIVYEMARLRKLDAINLSKQIKAMIDTEILESVKNKTQ